MRRALLLVPLAVLVQAPAARADSETAGTAVAIALPLAAAGIAAYKRDWNGVVDLGLTTIATVGTAYALKHLVKEQRPDGSDFQSFPSDTTALAASGSSFLWARYGWQYGVPALAATAFVGWSRVDAQKHHWYDVTASAALAFGVSKIFTTTYHPAGMRYGVTPTEGGAYAALSYNF